MVFATLSFARDEASAEPHTAVDLRSLLQRLCFDATDSGHQVLLSAGDTPVPFRCQPVAMRRALGNLIDNAVKYGGRAEVSLRQEENAIHILIEDEGPGIPEARFEEVFQPFRRLEQSRNRETGGTGLGLTLARTIIRAHGGDIRLSNRPGGGLRVQVILPC
jgi:signal transduction histidine kinase